MSKRTKDPLNVNPWPGILERRIDARLKADAVSAAKHRLAEAALKATNVNIQKRTVLLTFADMTDASACVLSLDDLRRLKGEG